MISEKQAIILKLLQDGGEMYGLEMIDMSGGHLKRGSVYVFLDRMEDAGLIKSRMRQTPEGKQGPPRRVYKISGLGSRALAEWLDRHSSVNAIFGMGGA